MLPDQPDDNSISGVEPEERAPSLREIAEAAYDEGLDDSDDGDDGPSDRGDGRDRRGRFASKEQAQKAGEAEADEPPSPDPSEEAQDRPDPAPKGPSNQPPEHWSAEDRAAFDRLPPDAKNFFMRRYSEMEADYTRKSQAASSAVNFTNSLSPVFTDPVIRQSLQAENRSPVEAIHEWAGFHKRAMHQDPRERLNLLVELAQRVGFDPARLFVTAQSNPPPVLSEKDMADPAIRYFADHQSRTQTELQALRAELQGMQQAERQARDNEQLEQTRWGIDQFAAEKGANGQPLRPHFDAALPMIIELFKANPERDLQEAYEQAIWAMPEIRKQLLDAERYLQQGQSNVERAKLAARGNTRGITAPVVKPNAKTGQGSLRDTLEKAADEVGFN